MAVFTFPSMLFVDLKSIDSPIMSPCSMRISSIHSMLVSRVVEPLSLLVVVLSSCDHAEL